MKILTVINNKDNFGFNLLWLSCSIQRLDLTVLVHHHENFHSNRIKDELLAEYLEANANNDELIFFTDGNDAIFLSLEKEIITKFNRIGKELLFSAETSCWPDESIASEYPAADVGPYRFLNSGRFIGKAGVIKEMLNDNSFDSIKFQQSNQYPWAKKFLRYPQKIGIDSACEIFYTFSPELGTPYLPDGIDIFDMSDYNRFVKKWFGENFRIENNRIYSKITGTWPCHAHFNGFSKEIIDYNIFSMIVGTVPGLEMPHFYERKTERKLTTF